MQKELEYFIMDLIDLLKEDAMDAKNKYIKNKNKKGSKFYSNAF